MFNNNKEVNNVNGTSPQSPSLNMISEGTRLKGSIQSQNDIRLSGKMEGEISSKGKLIITSTGIIQGNAKVTDADISGHINGEIHVINKLILRKSAKIDGNIFTKTLIVEEGAQINGDCNMGAEQPSKGIVSEESTKDKNKIKA
ncbi:MAG: polymer-forming cytoskeletal protein [Balneolaceae bacterium]